MCVNNIHVYATDRQEERYPHGRARAGDDERPKSQLETNTPDQPTTRQNTDWSRTCSCGKVCKNGLGLKIHRTKMGCPPILNLLQRTRQLGETEEELDQEEHHSVQSLQASDEGEESIESSENVNGRGVEESGEQKEKVMWPASTEKGKWKTSDEEMDSMMETVLVGKVENKLHTMSEIIYIFGKERFGVEKVKEKIQVRENRKLQKISNLRGDLRRLKARYRDAGEEERPALTELRGRSGRRYKVSGELRICAERGMRDSAQKIPSSL